MRAKPVRQEAARDHQKGISEDKRRVDAAHLRRRDPKILDHLRTGDRHDCPIEVAHHAETKHQHDDRQLRRIQTPGHGTLRMAQSSLSVIQVRRALSTVPEPGWLILASLGVALSPYSEATDGILLHVSVLLENDFHGLGHVRATPDVRRGLRGLLQPHRGPLFG